MMYVHRQNNKNMAGTQKNISLLITCKSEMII